MLGAQKPKSSQKHSSHTKKTKHRIFVLFVLFCFFYPFHHKKYIYIYKYSNLQLLDPCLCTRKCLRVSDIIHNNGSLRAAVVHGRQAVVALLASCVPNLKLNRCVFQAHRLCQEGGCAMTKRRKKKEESFYEWKINEERKNCEK